MRHYPAAMRIDETRGLGEDDGRLIRLWAAVFRQGLVDAAGETARGKPGRAARWLASDENTPGSFVWLCDLFDVHPDRARRCAKDAMPRLAPRPGAMYCASRVA